jgi:hypothetical protein
MISFIEKKLRKYIHGRICLLYVMFLMFEAKQQH